MSASRPSDFPLDVMEVERGAARAALMLARPDAWLQADGSGYRVRIGADGRRRPLMRLDEAVFERLTREPGLGVRPEGGWRLARGRVSDCPTVRRNAAGRTGIVEGERVVLTPEGRMETRRVNLGESPLAWLARRQGPDGRPWLTPAELMAGERLRGDFERSGTLGRLTMDWNAGPRVRGGRGPGTDPLEHGRSARARVAAALNDVGPELRGVLEQVCLRGVGLGAAETTLRLPRRAGKTVLKLALQRLASHYRIG